MFVEGGAYSKQFHIASDLIQVFFEGWTYRHNRQ
jgi:hypothetical protein